MEEFMFLEICHFPEWERQVESLVSVWDVGFDLRRLCGFTANSESNYSFGQLVMRQFSRLTTLARLIFCLVNTETVVPSGHS